MSQNSQNSQSSNYGPQVNSNYEQPKQGSLANISRMHKNNIKTAKATQKVIKQMRRNQGPHGSLKRPTGGKRRKHRKRTRKSRR